MGRVDAAQVQSVAQDMKILIAAKHPPDGALKIGGVQSWSKTVGDELRSRGHEVRYWGPGGCLSGLFDLGIIANVGDTHGAMQLCEKTIVVCHGIIPAEKPPLHNVAFTSEEVRDHWKGDGPVIRQPINLDFWRPAKHKVKRYLVRFSYRGGLPFVRTIAKRMGLKYLHIKSETQEVVRALLNQAACVVATGRAAVETMACGVPVVICDARAYQGPLLDPDTLGSMHRNYSGRGGVAANETNVLLEIEKAIECGGLRTHVEVHHNVHAITDQLLAAVCTREFV